MLRSHFLVGERFGRLKIVAHAGRTSERDNWKCLCDCGATVIVRQNNLRSGNTTSCGCARVKHGRSKHSPGTRDRTYTSWQMMKRRTTTPTAQERRDYVARGITACPRWLGSFELFLQDMGERPPNTSLDRIDNDRGYEPGNVRWATRKEQQRNRRTNRLLTLNGESLPLAEWAERLGVHSAVIAKRLRLGWSVKDALTKKSAAA